jgi:xylan 1,4-beta-xylosidase
MDQLVQVNIDAAKKAGILGHTWNYIGYDECNYTHSPGGVELIKKIGKLEKPYYIRTHHMLCTGTCHGVYKWGSTNIYMEDDNGMPIYYFDVIDRICDNWLANKCKPFFEIGFMPYDLVDLDRVKVEASKSYTEFQRKGKLYSEYQHTLWSSPPKDFDK